jgi:2'-5' RNA ligase
MRLFIAFEIPETFNSDLIATQKRIRAKATLPKTFHLTLKFLGEVEEGRVSHIISELEQIKFSAFDARFSSMGAFPDSNRARVIWLGLEPRDVITDIQKQIEFATKGIGDAEKEFVPHITLARIKFIDNKKEFADSLKSLNPPPASFRLDSFKLIKSVLTPEGPVYEVLRDFSVRQ